MTVKNSAPTFSDVERNIRTADESRLINILLGPKPDDSQYLHWEQLLHRTPPVGLSHEEWWMALKMQRLNNRRELPLYDAAGKPFWFSYNDEVLKLSEEIARRTGGLSAIGTGQTARVNSRYLLRSLLEEAITSSQLEGASTSRKHAKRMIEAGLAPTDNSDRMILNNFLAMKEVKEHAGNELTPEWVYELHRVLTTGTLDNPDEVGRPQAVGEERVSVVDQRERVTHTPPSAEFLPDRIEAVCTFANGTVDETPYLSPVIRAIVTHFMFGHDHYFADGNGRTARIAFYWVMLHNGYHLAEHVAVSRVLRMAPAKYGMAYEYSEDDEGDLTYFILHQLRAFKRALGDFEDYVAEKLEQSQDVKKLLRNTSSLLNERQTYLIEWLIREEIPTVLAKEVASRFAVTEQTARNDLGDLAALGLLTPSAGRRPIVWTVARDLASKLEDLSPPSA